MGRKIGSLVALDNFRDAKYRNELRGRREDLGCKSLGKGQKKNIVVILSLRVEGSKYQAEGKGMGPP